MLSNFLTSDGAAEPSTLEGYLHDRENRKMYACMRSLESPDRLRIHACVGVQMLGQTQTWTRISE